MSVKYTNFVDININRHISSNPTGLRDTAAVIFYKSNATDNIKDCGVLTKTSTPDADLADFTDYIDAFFKNGGRKLHCILTKLALTTTSGSPAVTTINAAFKAILDSLPMEEIMVGLVGDTEANARVVAADYNEAYATEKIYQKIFVAEIPFAVGTAISSQLNSYKDGDEKVVSIENYVLKFGDLGIGASVLAYYTQINAYTTDSAEDYCYTKEKYSEEDEDHLVFNDNELVKTAMALDINIDINLSNAVRNIGGNDTMGYSLTNQYMLLVMHQTLTQQLLNLLASKIKYNSQGLTSVLNVLTSELDKYVNNGFLSTNKVWTDEDLYFGEYLIIEENTLLNLGYKIVILPFESLTPSEIEARQLPKIYILVADAYAIRKIVVNGELF